MDFINLELTKKFKLITAIIETILALAGIWSSIMFIFFILHLITLFFSIKTDAPKMGSIAGVFINIIWWIPIVGFFGRTAHLIVAILLWFDYSRIKSLQNQEIKK